jgi:hypothetical protein
MEHSFTETIKSILNSHFGEISETLFEKSELVQYLNLKTKSANKGSKARGNFANRFD